MRLVWDRNAWEDYNYWHATGRKILKRVNTRIDACLREPFAGIGKPEQLNSGAQGAWSRLSPPNIDSYISSKVMIW